MKRARWQDDERLVVDSGYALGWGVLGGIAGAAMAWKGWTEGAGVTSIAMVAIGTIGALMFISHAARRERLEVEKHALHYSSTWGPFGKAAATAQRGALNAVWLHQTKGPTGRIMWRIEVLLRAAGFPPFLAVDEYANAEEAREAATLLASRLGVQLDTNSVYDPSIHAEEPPS